MRQESPKGFGERDESITEAESIEVRAKGIALSDADGRG